MAIKSSDQITIVDVTDAYSVILTSEAYTFVGNTSGAPAGLSCTTQAVAYCGTNQCSSVAVTASNITCPTGISAQVSNSGSVSPTITFTTTATITEGCEATIPVVVDGITVNKKFSFSVAKQGQTGATGPTGVGIKSITNYYLATSSGSGVTASTSGWTTSVQSVSSSKKYLWNYEKVTYTNNTNTSTTPCIIGVYGDTGSTGATGVGITSITEYYLASSSATGITTSSSGWTTTMQSTTTTEKYLWNYEKITYTDGSTENTTTRIIGTHGATGATGAAGADAIALTITASNGTVFKNSSGSTVLTAHVYKGGVEQSITDAGVCGTLGSIKWYKGTSTTAVATAKTLTVSATEVTNTAAYTCQLEG